MTHSITRRISQTSTIALTALIVFGVSGCETKPRPVGIVHRLGDVAYARGDYTKAEAEYLEVIERRPERWDARLNLGRLYVEQGRFAEARDQLDVAYTLAPDNDRVLEEFSRTLIELDQTDQAIDELRRVARTRNTPEDWHRLGRFLTMIGDTDHAEQALITAARLDQGASADIQRSLGALYAQAGDDERALARYSMALYLDPQDPIASRAIRNLGQVPGPTIARRPIEQTPNGR